MPKKYKYRYARKINGIRIDVHAHTQAELIEKVQKKKETLGLRDQNITVPELIDRWLALKEPTVSPSTFYGYRCYAKHIDLKKRVTDVVQSDLQMLLNREPGMSKSHYKMLMITMKQIFDLAVSDRIINFNPASGLQKPHGTQKKRRSITDEERQIFLKACDRYDNSLPFLIMPYTGLRPSETRKLMGCDLDIREKLLLVTDHGKGLKTASAERVIPIPDVLLPKLKGFKDDEYVICTKDARPVTKDRLDAWWKSLRRIMHIEAGGQLFRNAVVDDRIAKDFTMYCLRHTYCTDLEKAGVPITVASRLMGHSKLELTAKIYTHHNAESIEKAREKINSL